MPQKPVIKGKKIEKKAAANRHGKVAKTTKGHFEKPPVKTKLLEAYKDNKELTKTINATNESNIAAKAENAGGRLKSLKAGPPVLAPKSRKKAAAAAAAPAVPESMQQDED
ncbi:hypothetical protein V8C86DRAFT_2689452 [Haematococcus lacustris]